MDTEKKKVKMFEIYTYDFGDNSGSVQCGARPVLVIQDDRFNDASPTTIIAPFTSALKKEYLMSHIRVDESTGLRQPSMVLMEQVKTVNQDELGEY